MTTLRKMTDPGPGFHVNFAANALGCAPVRVESLAQTDGRTSARKLSRLRQYSSRHLGIDLIATQEVEPVFGEVLAQMACDPDRALLRLKDIPEAFAPGIQPGVR